MNRFAHLSFLALTLMFLNSGISAAAGAKAQPLSVSLPHFILRKNEAVVAFQCTVTGGDILMTKTPDQWETDVKNGEQDVATISATILMGQAAFTNTDLGYFNDFIVVQRSKDPDPYPRPFDIEVDVEVSTDIQMKKYRTIKFRMKDLKLRQQR